MRERGQVLPLVAVVLVVAGAAMWCLGRLSGAAVERARARTAADAAALAGAAEGEAAARSIAAANGGRLVSFVRAGADVIVRVEVGDATAPARARREGVQPGMAGIGQGSGGVSPTLRRAAPP